MTKILQILIVVLLSCFTEMLTAQDYYWVAFANKNNTQFSLSNPSQYLSKRAIERRTRQQIAIDSLDLPVNKSYISEVIKVGATYKHASKWLNGITVLATTDTFKTAVLKLPFVKEIQRTKTKTTKSAIQKFGEPDDGFSTAIDSSLYGPSVSQTSIMNGQFLHNMGHKGKGMQIAILDGGFYNANKYNAFDSLWVHGRILGTKDFVHDSVDIFSTDSHGMSVLSCMGGNIPGKLIGTATEASYWLIRSEDTGSEFLIEEDNWVAAAEFADSVGADVINSSLGYSQFDDAQMNHTYADLDGKTTRVTQGANIAASRGMLVFVSAGNEGNKAWKYILAPSDGEKVFGVGAVNKDSIPAPFTSYGPAFGGKTKPNVSAIGWYTWLVNKTGTLSYANGTSFSSPVMAGMATCLWQAVPHVSAKELKGAIEKKSHLFANPDSLLGYGIPDFEKLWWYYFPLSVSDYQNIAQWAAYPNPVKDNLVLYHKNGQITGNINIEIYSTEGRLVQKWVKPGAQRIELWDVGSLPNGILLLKISSEKSSETIKLSKVK